MAGHREELINIGLSIALAFSRTKKAESFEKGDAMTTETITSATGTAHWGRRETPLVDASRNKVRD